jgi:hypothetical protein
MKQSIGSIYDTKFITQAMFESLIEDIKEIIRLLVSSLKRLKNKTVV